LSLGNIKEMLMSKNKSTSSLPEILVILVLLVFAGPKLFPDLITEIPETSATSPISLSVATESNVMAEKPVETNSGIDGISYNFKNIEFIEIIPVDNSGYAINPDQPTTCSINANWPAAIQQWCGWITQYSNEFGVEADIIAAVMMTESNGNKDALGFACDTGLMQVMPSDGKLVGPTRSSKCDLTSGSVANYNTAFNSMLKNRPTMEQLWIPQYNIFVGAQMVGGSYANSGSYRTALLRYNGGSTYPDKVFKNYQQYVGTPPQ